MLVAGHTALVWRRSPTARADTIPPWVHRKAASAASPAASSACTHTSARAGPLACRSCTVSSWHCNHLLNSCQLSNLLENLLQRLCPLREDLNQRLTARVSLSDSPLLRYAQQQQEMNLNLRQQLGSDYTNPQQPNFTAAAPTQSFNEVPKNSPQDIEIISAKLDVIKANLDAINTRLANLERMANSGQADSNQRW